MNRPGLVLSELSVGGRIASFLIYRADLIIRRGVVFLRPYLGKDIGLRWAIGFDSEQIFQNFRGENI